MATQSERVRKLFDRHVDSMRIKSVKWTIKGDSKWGDKRIAKYIKYFSLPIQMEEVIALLDTTVLRSGKEGLLFTTSGIVVKEIASGLYYLDFAKIASAEVVEETDDYYNVNTSLWIHFLDGTKKMMFDYYINKVSVAAYINDVVQKKEYRDD